jgi:hypothetical protein
VKHDGYRVLVIRENEDVRLLQAMAPTRASAILDRRDRAEKPAQHFVLYDEAVILGIDGIFFSSGFRTWRRIWPACQLLRVLRIWRPVLHQGAAPDGCAEL